MYLKFSSLHSSDLFHWNYSSSSMLIAIFKLKAVFRDIDLEDLENLRISGIKWEIEKEKERNIYLEKI